MELEAGLSVGIRHTALALRVDSITGEVVTALRDAGIRALLLKGPSFAKWLYGDGGARPYGDSDLLVAPDSYLRSETVLRGLGFRSFGYSRHPHSHTWRRPGDGSYVDLHRSLIGVSAPPEVVWSQLAAQTETLRVGGVSVECLTTPARALHVALHAAQHGESDDRPVADLARALEITDRDVWEEAAGLARALQAESAFATGLRLDPRGAPLAERLNLAADQPRAVTIRAGPKVPVAIGVDDLISERSLRGRASLLLRTLAPKPLYMRHWRGTQLTGRPAKIAHGPLGLWFAYAYRPIWIAMHLPGAIKAVREADAKRDGPEADEPTELGAPGTPPEGL
jgi:hypothetical protein